MLAEEDMVRYLVRWLVGEGDKAVRLVNVWLYCNLVFLVCEEWKRGKAFQPGAARVIYAD